MKPSKWFCQFRKKLYGEWMSIDLQKSELASLAEQDCRRIMAWLISLGDGQNPVYRREMARRIDDCEPQNWFTEEQLEQRLGPLA